MDSAAIPRLIALVCLALLMGRIAPRAEENSSESAPYDAVAAAPDNHRVIFENEKVRGLDVTIKPGEKESFHEHPCFSVMNIIVGAPLRITQATLQDGNIVNGKTIEVGKDNFQPSAALDASSRSSFSRERRDGGLSSLSHRTERG
jgi:hypothetical protein